MLNGGLSITGSTRLVVVGSEESPPGAGNTLQGGGSVTIGSNTGGAFFAGNTGSCGSLAIESNTGSVPRPDTGAVVATDNSVACGTISIQ